MTIFRNLSIQWTKRLFSNGSSVYKTVPLAFDKLHGERNSPIVIIHGLLGNRNNWKSIAKAINTKTQREIYLLDARNHGQSPHTLEMNYVLMGQDLVHFLDAQELPSATVMGHSMGGRIAMAAALNNPERVSQLIALDISPYGVSETVSSLPRFVETMLRINLPSDLAIPHARKVVDNLLQPIVPMIGVRQFLITNLYKDEQSGTFKWRANLESISLNFNPHLCTFPVSECGSLYTGPTAFIGGADSDYIRTDEHNAIQTLFPRATFSYIDGAGHWLHSDKPKEFIETVLPLFSTG